VFVFVGENVIVAQLSEVGSDEGMPRVVSLVLRSVRNQTHNSEVSECPLARLPNGSRSALQIGMERGIDLVGRTSLRQ
jgi:hypothetical protein